MKDISFDTELLMQPKPPDLHQTHPDYYGEYNLPTRIHYVLSHIFIYRIYTCKETPEFYCGAVCFR